MAKDKEKKLKSKNKKLKKKLDAALRHIAQLEGKDPDQFVSEFEQEDHKKTTDKLLTVLGLEEKTARHITDKLETAGYTAHKNNGARLVASEISPEDFIEQWKEKTFKTIPVQCFKGEGENAQKDLEKMVRELVDHYCDCEHVVSDNKRNALVKYIMLDDEDARKAFKYLREYRGDLKKGEFPNSHELTKDPNIANIFSGVVDIVKQAGIDLSGGKAIVEQIIA